MNRDRRKPLLVGVILSVALSLVALAPLAHAEYTPVITIEQLLNPCIEGDNDSRNGVISEMECEQYIHGLLDAYLTLRPEKKLCFPDIGNPVDVVRREFMRWAYKNYSDRAQPAATGLNMVIEQNYLCP